MVMLITSDNRKHNSSEYTNHKNAENLHPKIVTAQAGCCATPPTLPTAGPPPLSGEVLKNWPPLKGNVINLATDFPEAFPLGEGGLPRSGKTDEVLGGWLRAFIITEAQSIMSGDLRR